MPLHHCFLSPLLSPKTTLSVWLFTLMTCVQAQPVQHIWDKQIDILTYSFFRVGNFSGAAGTDEEGETVLSIFDENGNQVSSTHFPQIENLGSAHYDSISQHFYLVGTDSAINNMIFLKVGLNGALIWQRQKAFTGVYFPYKIRQYEQMLAFTFAEIDTTGQSNGIGWWMMDTQGNDIGVYYHPLEQDSGLAIPYASTFDRDGRLVIATIGLLDAVDKLYVFDPFNNTLYWEKSLEFEMYGSILDLATDDAGNIYLSGDQGHLIKLSKDGDLLFSTDLGYDDGSIGSKILLHNGELYVLGGWRQGFLIDEFDARMLIGKYNSQTGAPLWVWTYDHTGIENGPLAMDGYFTNDSTLMIHFVRLFTSDWIGQFRLNNNASAIAQIQPPTGVALFPNPSPDGAFYIQQSTEKQARVSITDASGKLISNQLYTPGQQLSTPRSGAYLVRYEDGTAVKTWNLVSTQKQ